MQRLLTILATTGALALAAAVVPTGSQAAPYWAYRHHSYRHHHYGWRAFHSSTCDFRTFSRDRQLQGTC